MTTFYISDIRCSVHVTVGSHNVTKHHAYEPVMRDITRDCYARAIRAGVVLLYRTKSREMTKKCSSKYLALEHKIKSRTPRRFVV